MKQKHIIGIVGGLGPFAHIDYERKLLQAAQSIAGATSDQAFPEWILSSVPRTPDRTLRIVSDGADPVPDLLRSLRRLERGDEESPGAGFATISCNSAHYFLPELRAALSIPILDMIGLTCEAIAREYPGATVGILATTGTAQSGLYHRALEARGLKPVSPLDTKTDLQESHVMVPIFGRDMKGQRSGGIKGDGPKPEYADQLTHAAAVLRQEFGAAVVIGACTEIPVAITGDKIGRRTVRGSDAGVGGGGGPGSVWVGGVAGLIVRGAIDYLSSGWTSSSK